MEPCNINDILCNLVGGSPVLYPLCAVALFVVYISACYGIYYALTRRKNAATVL